MNAEIARIAEQFRLAALDQTGWITALDALASATRSLRGQLIGIAPGEQQAFNWCTNIDDAAIRCAKEVGALDPSLSFRLAASVEVPPGTIVDERHYRRVTPRLRSSVYLDFCREYDLPHGCQTALPIESGMVLGFAILRAARDGPTGAADRALFAALVPDVTAAVSLQIALEQKGAAIMAGTLDAIATAALLLDRLGNVVAVTSAADALLSSSAQIDVVDNVLVAQRAEDTQAIAHAIRSVAAGTVPAAGLTLTSAAEPPLRLTAYRLAEGDYTLGIAPRVAVILKSRLGAHARDVAMLRDRYGLSIAECDIACRLADGDRRDEIATARGTRLGTVRHQLKTIFSKLGVQREAELVARVAALCDDGPN